MGMLRHLSIILRSLPAVRGRRNEGSLFPTACHSERSEESWLDINAGTVAANSTNVRIRKAHNPRNATLDARGRVRVEARVAKHFLLEISVGTVERVVAAERGGADRIELCADLSVGGLTPSRELLRAVRAAVRIPIFSMIRPRGGDFVYSAAEFEEMKRAIEAAKESGMNGVVLGILHKDCRIDVERTRELVALAQPLPVTFHRAFDECCAGDDCSDIAREGVEIERALEDVIQAGAARILTSGGAKSALEGAGMLAKLIAAAGNRVAILPGAGISAANVAEAARRTGACEFHSGLSSVLPYSSRDFSRFESEVAKLARQLADLATRGS